MCPTGRCSQLPRRRSFRDHREEPRQAHGAGPFCHLRAAHRSCVPRPGKPQAAPPLPPPPPSFQHRTSRSAAPVCAHSTPSCQHRTANDRPTTTPRSRRLHSARHLRRLPGTAGQEPLLTHHAPGLATGARADMMRQRTTASIPGQSWVMTRRARVVFAVRRQSRPAYRPRRFSIPARASPPARDGQVAHA